MPFADRTDGSVFYVSRDTTRLFSRSAPRETSPKDPVLTELLWGDRVRLLRDRDGAFREENGRVRARARGRYGWVDRRHLGARSLLELYFVDVGQGDGILIRTPNGRHLLIDGGWPRRSQPTGKNAADFVDWKFMRDYESPDRAIELDAMICTHNDQDHYGGLSDLLDPAQRRGGDAVELDAAQVFVERFLHAGLAWWRTPSSSRTLGPVAATSQGPMHTLLLGDRPSVDAGLRPDANPRLQGEWASFLQRVRDARTRSGDATPIERLSHRTGLLPGFDEAGLPSAQVTPEPRIHVLAPVEFEVDGAPAIRNYGSTVGLNTNGNSVLLRLDCGQVRILLTGDLNTRSQAALLEDYAGQEHVFECDVGKACHHGSGDVSFRFLSSMAPSVTIISSGDSEGHDHPRPEIIAASAITGHREVRNDKLVTPLVFMTELARSIEIGKISRVHAVTAAGDDGDDGDELAPGTLRATARVTMAGDLQPTTVQRSLAGRYLVTGLVYGLINVRTDGQRILCAALNEKSRTWNVSVVQPKPRP